MMHEDLYIIDNDSLSKLSNEELNSTRVQSQSCIIEEVAYEARYNPRTKAIRHLIQDPDDDLFAVVRELLGQPIVQKLLDLYNNEGNGDVLVLAKAMIEKRNAQLELFGRRAVIVTDDKGLTGAANANSITTINTSTFKKLLN